MRLFLSSFFQSGKVIGDFSLGVEFVAQTVSTIAFVDEEAVTAFIGIVAEEGVEHIVHDIWACLPVDINPEVVTVAKFVRRIGQGAVKYSEQSVYGIHRNLPDAEKSEHVVYTVGIKVFGHFTETGFPPCETVFGHFVPVVGR